MVLIPDSQEDKAKLLDLFVDRILAINKKSGQVIGTYQILTMLEDISIEEGLIECPHCHNKNPRRS